MSRATPSLRILLVDDDEADVFLTRKALERAGIEHELHVANDGEDGLAFLRRQGRHEEPPRPDLILLDLNMPRMGGKEFLTAVKADRDLRSIPVVVLTTSRDEADVRASYDLQAASYVAKPSSGSEFMDMMRGFHDYWLSIVRLPTRAGAGS